MQGLRELPTVPMVLVQPKAMERTLVGNSSQMQTQKTDQKEQRINLIMKRITSSMMTLTQMSHYLGLKKLRKKRVRTRMKLQTVPKMEQYFLLILEMISQLKMQLSVSDTPTIIWFRYRFSPMSVRMKMIPQQMSWTLKKTNPVIREMVLRLGYLNRSQRLLLLVISYLSEHTASTSLISSQANLFILAILLKYFRVRGRFLLSVNLGDSRTQKLPIINSKEGKSRKTQTFSRQLFMQQKMTAMRASPTPNPIWSEAAQVSRTLLETCSDIKLKCRVIAGLTPNPARKSPRPTVDRSVATATKTTPSVEMAQLNLSEIFLPQLSARKGKMKKPTREPMYTRDWRMLMKASYSHIRGGLMEYDIELKFGFFKFFTHQLLLRAQTLAWHACSFQFYRHSSQLLTNRKFSPSRMKAAISHCAIKSARSLFWQVWLPPTRQRRSSMVGSKRVLSQSLCQS